MLFRAQSVALGTTLPYDTSPVRALRLLP